MHILLILICYRLLLCAVYPLTVVIAIVAMCINIAGILPIAWLISRDPNTLDNFMHKLITITLDTVCIPEEFIEDKINQLITGDKQ